MKSSLKLRKKKVVLSVLLRKGHCRLNMSEQVVKKSCSMKLWVRVILLSQAFAT